MTICIILPVFKQSALAIEAVTSFLDQPESGSHHLVIVDDGCPLPNTLFGLAGIACRHENVAYIRRNNGGLSAARNTGIDFALKTFLTDDAFFFLDADNRLSPSSLSRFEAALSTSDADWFFPDIEMFGSTDASFDFSGPYSAYLHALQNICEAGSLVRRRVLDAGLRFDESMKLGYEDWDFWLSAVERGFCGEHLAASGFKYRKRSESMISASERVDVVIKHYLRTKHKWMANPCALTMLEHRVSPRYAIVDLAAGQVVMGSDPTAMSASMSLEEYSARLRRAIASPTAHAPGSFLVFMSHDLLGRCRELKIANWLFLEIERPIRKKHPFLLAPFAGAQGRPRKACIAALPVSQLPELLERSEAAWHDLRDAPCYHNDTLDGFMAEAFDDLDEAVDEEANLWAFLRTERTKSLLPLHSGRRRANVGRPELQRAPLLARELFAAEGGKASDTPLPNRVTSRRARWVLVVDGAWAAFAERLASLAHALAERDHVPDLIFLGPLASATRTPLVGAFGAIYALERSSARFGAADAGLFTNLLSSYEAVLLGATNALSSLVGVRQRGVVGVALQAFDHASWLELPHLTGLVSYEHVIDLHVVETAEMRGQLMVRGVPHSKILESRIASLADAPCAVSARSAHGLVAAVDSILEMRRLLDGWALDGAPE